MKFKLPEHSTLLDKSFLYGTATASFQIEGDSTSRLPCIWDTFCATAGNIADASNGDQACEHIAKWREDIDLIHSLGVDAYRFSISWPRVIGFDGKLNPQGVDFYIQLLEYLIELGIKPFVTLYHWDLPQHIEDNGGWLNRQTAYLFRDYVDLITQAFGERVHSYATLNEPFCSAYLGYEVGIHAPGLTGQDKGKQAAHHLLLAHGLAMQVLRKNSPKALNGIVLNFTPAYPVSDSQADINAAAYADDYLNHWYAEPVFNGCYPEILNQLPAENRPQIEEGDMQIIAQPLDYVGINYYTRAFYKADDNLPYCAISPKGVELTAMGWEVYPDAFRDLLIDLNKRYTLPPVYITENGAATDDEIIDGSVDDQQRINYIQGHLLAVHQAIEAGVDIQGYFVWSLLDNFEWAEGYVKRFGIVYVDYQTQQRTKKRSAELFTELVTTRINQA
ncbi:GH1 family beta-glucosidase [Alteromonadaceae bacterium BrNp21-10]|nr:GH1 family beta-glucosidase [Alteromonadaceae bacterium BrNp21-10]